MRRARLPVTVGLGLALLGGSAGVSMSGAAQPGQASSIRVLDTRAQEPQACAEVRPKHDPFISGGCRVSANATSTVLTVRTALGRMRFGRCLTNLDVSFAPDGRFWLDNIKIGGAAPCSDAWPCSPPEVIALRKPPSGAPPSDKVAPWRGAIHTGEGGRVEGSFRFCIDTCIGRYGGEVAVRFLPVTGGGWRMTADSASVGSSPLEIDADWDLFDLRTRTGPAQIDIQRVVSPGAGDSR